MSDPNAEVGEQAIVNKVAAICRGDEKHQKEYLTNLITRWDVTSRGMVSKYGFEQALIPLKLRIQPQVLDAVFAKYHAGNGYMDTNAFFDTVYGGERRVAAPQVSMKHPAVKTALDEFRQAIKRRGGLNGIRALGRSFRIYDVNDDNMLSPNELKSGLQNFGLQLPGPTVDLVIDAIDKNRDGKVDYNEFLRGVRGGMNKFRLGLVRQAYDVLDRDNSGQVDANDMKLAYNAASHPYVKQGRMTAQQALRDFMSQWDTLERDGIVTIQEFNEYYEDLSASVDRDDYFELMIRNAWHISGGKGWSENTANTRVLVQEADGTQHVVEIKNDLGVKAGDYDELQRRLQQQGSSGQIVRPGQKKNDLKRANAQQPALRQRGYSRNGPPPAQTQYRQAPQSRGQSRGQVQSRGGGDRGYNQNRNQAPPSRGRGQAPPSRGQVQSRGQSRQGITSSQTRARGQTGQGKLENKFTANVVQLFKEAVISHGGENGINALGRIFRRMDDNNDFELSVPELKSGLADYGLHFTAHDCATLLTALDNNNSGSVSYNEFLRAVRGEMNDRRRGLVLLAFKSLDRSGDGVATVDDLIGAYNGKKHPEVIAGRKTEREVLTIFLNNWDGGEKDGIVTIDEFVEYYTGVSASIDLDDYFELMIRNAWRISGGQGQYENTANLRVLVTFTDGRKEVVEVKNSLGLDTQNLKGIKGRLRHQGVTNIAKVATYYADQ